MSSIISNICNYAEIFVVDVFGRALLNGFEEPENREINVSHFIPCNRFGVYVRQQGESNAQYQLNQVCKETDLSNGDIYRKDGQIRMKCLMLSTVGIIAQGISMLLNLINRIAKLISFAHFWYPSEKEYSLSERAWTFGKDLLRVIFSPVIFVMIEVAALYGLASPRDGRKLYATFERCAYGNGLVATCFQPGADRHLLRGDINDPNAW